MKAINKINMALTKKIFFHEPGSCNTIKLSLRRTLQSLVLCSAKQQHIISTV